MLGVVLSIGEHTLDLQMAPTNGPGLVWHDAGYSDLIKVWDHQIRLEDYYGMTRYTDEVEVHAGLLTGPAWLFAYAYYTHRQRRLNRLVAWFPRERCRTRGLWTTARAGWRTTRRSWTS